MLMLLFGLLLLVPVAAIGIGWFLSITPYRGPKTDHFDGRRFVNPEGQEARGFGEVMKWLVNRERTPWTSRTLPEIIASPLEHVTGDCRITFINHSTLLIQTGGVNILTDPVWSKRVSPFSFAGPKRFHPPAIPLDQLPEIHLVLLSHNHYDHMDLPTLKALDQRFRPEMVAPLGNRKFLEEQAFRVAAELDWWESAMVSDHCRITATPASHFSGRGLFDRDRALWCGFYVEAGAHTVYYMGDSGYGSFFKQIRERLGAPDMAIIPIGAFKPQWFMRPIHMGPEEAIQAWKDLGRPPAVACHFGTFPLADDGPTEPQDLLAAKMEPEAGWFEALEPGRFRELSAYPSR